MSVTHQRLAPAPAAIDRAVYQWSLGISLVTTLAYGILAVATLRDTTVDGMPVSAIDATWPFWLGTGLVAILAGGLSQMVIQLARPRQPLEPTGDPVPFFEDQQRGNLAWVLPAMAATSSVLLVRLYHTPLAGAIGALALFMVTMLTIVTHYHLRDERTFRRTLASVGLSFLTHASAFFLLTMIYSNKWRSMYSAVAIGLATLLMLLQLTDGIDIAWLRRLLYALIGGLLMGQMTWALNYWAATGWIGGAMLLVCFYALAGLTAHAITARLDRRIIIEYSLVVAVAFVIISVSLNLYR